MGLTKAETFVVAVAVAVAGGSCRKTAAMASGSCRQTAAMAGRSNNYSRHTKIRKGGRRGVHMCVRVWLKSVLVC